MAEVVVITVILEDQDVDPFEVDMVLMEAEGVPLSKDPDNVGTVDAVITSLKSAERNLIDLSGQSYLILIFRPVCNSSGLFIRYS